MGGRGVAVSKSDFATYAWALLKLREAQRQGASYRSAVELHFTFDEEARRRDWSALVARPRP